VSVDGCNSKLTQSGTLFVPPLYFLIIALTAEDRSVAANWSYLHSFREHFAALAVLSDFAEECLKFRLSCTLRL
jgi:hypothetical protein